MAKIDIKAMFSGKKKYVSIGAIVLVAVLAIFANRNKGARQGDANSPRLSSYDYGGKVTGSGGGGGGNNGNLTIADVQSAIGDYAKKDQENTQKQFEQLNKSNMSALQGITDGFNTAMTNQAEANRKSLEALNNSTNSSMDKLSNSLSNLANNQTQQIGMFQDQLSRIQDQNASWQRQIGEQFQNQMRNMMSDYEKRYSRMDTPDTTTSWSSGSSSSYSSSSSPSKYESSDWGQKVTSGNVTTYYDRDGNVSGRTTNSSSSSSSNAIQGHVVESRPASTSSSSGNVVYGRITG